MSTGDMPTMASASYASTAYAANNLGLPISTTAGSLGGVSGLIQRAAQRFDVADHKEFIAVPAAATVEVAMRKKPMEQTTMTRRLVQVFIADPDENLPLEQALLYSGDQKFTDATDQELFFEIDMKSILAAHNEKRITVLNKKVKDRAEYLEPAKIRDLKMVVVNVATF